MIGRFGPARLIALGAVAPPLGYALYLLSGDAPTYLTGVLPAMVLVGLGFVLGFAALHVQATAGVAATEQKQTTGVYQTSVQIGGAVMLALVAMLLTTGPSNMGITDYRPALVLVTAVGAAGSLLALTGVFSRRRPRADDTILHRTPETGESA